MIAVSDIWRNVFDRVWNVREINGNKRREVTDIFRKCKFNILVVTGIMKESDENNWCGVK